MHPSTDIPMKERIRLEKLSSYCYVTVVIKLFSVGLESKITKLTNNTLQTSGKKYILVIKLITSITFNM